MNILHLKYAVEIAKSGSISKASEALLIAQPNLSRAVKDLEADLGITIFERSARGMVLTPDGEEFIGYADKILSQIDEVEKMYREGHSAKRRFSISVPRASYISEAFARFSAEIGEEPVELFYRETDSMRAIKNIFSSDYRLGIIRYAEGDDRYFKELFEEKGLSYELVAEFRYVLLMREDSPLAGKKEISFEDLEKYIEVAHGDPFVVSMPLSAVKNDESSENSERRIIVFERASQFDILSENRETFMWASSVPKKTLERYGLVQRDCSENKKKYRDVLIYRNDYKLSVLDKSFITALCRAKREYI